MTPRRTTTVLAAVERCRKRLWAHCYRMTGRRTEADDLSQEAIARAIERAEDIHDPATAEGWLFRIATTVCLDHLRRERRVRAVTELVDPVAFDELPAPPADVAHVAMHRIAGFWRFHRVHHSDPAVDVTTTIRQHPGEGVIRYAFLAAFALPLGASPSAFAVYRSWSALNGLLEHANVRAPLWLDTLLSLVTTWPGMHKVHDSRTAKQTNTNYGNIFSLFDRMFRTFTPAGRGRSVVYGLDGFDDPETQTTAGLLAVPFLEAKASSGVAAVGSSA